MKLTPLHDLVLVRLDEVEKVSDGGIFIPDAAAEKPNRGTVLAVGPGTHEKGQFRATKLKPNDIVLFGKNNGRKVKVDDEELVMLKEEEIYATIEE